MLFYHAASTELFFPMLDCTSHPDKHLTLFCPTAFLLQMLGLESSVWMHIAKKHGGLLDDAFEVWQRCRSARGNLKRCRCRCLKRDKCYIGVSPRMRMVGAVGLLVQLLLSRADQSRSW